MTYSKLLYKAILLSSLIFFPILFEYIYPFLPPYLSLKIGYDILVIIPFIILFTGIFVSIRIKHLRAFWDTILFLIVYLTIIEFEYIPFKDLQLSQIAQSFAVFVPLSVILMSLYPQKKFSIRQFSYQFMIIAGAIFLSFVIPLHFNMFFDIVFSSHIFINHPHWQLPDYIWFILIIMAFVLYQRSNSSNRPLLIVLSISIFMLFQALNLAAIVNAPTRKVILYTSIIFNGISVFAIYYLFYLRKKKELYDELTDLANEKFLRKVIESRKGNYTLAVLEADDSNHFLEKYGEKEHSNLIRFISHQLKRESDVEAFSLDNNRFALLYFTKNSADVLWQLNSIRGKISHKKFIIRNSEKARQISNKHDRGKLENWPDDIVITLSIGIVDISDSADTYESLKNRAIEALNSAKSRGGNRCVRAEDMIF